MFGEKLIFFPLVRYLKEHADVRWSQHCSPLRLVNISQTDLYLEGLERVWKVARLVVGMVLSALLFLSTFYVVSQSSQPSLKELLLCDDNI